MQTLHQTMTTIAAHLPGHWTVENDAAWINTLRRQPDGLRICARFYQNRIELYPTPFRSQKYPTWTYEEHRHFITISPTRPPAAAAASFPAPKNSTSPAANGWPISRPSRTPKPRPSSPSNHCLAPTATTSTKTASTARAGPRRSTVASPSI